jgi:hypothetical protein
MENHRNILYRTVDYEIVITVYNIALNELKDTEIHSFILMSIGQEQCLTLKTFLLVVW